MRLAASRRKPEAAMARTVAGVVEKPVDAQRMIDELVRDCLCDRSDISVIARDEAASSNKGARADELRHAVDQSAEGARTLFGGLLAGLETVSRAIPGGGVLRVIGNLGVAIANAGVATAAELTKALVSVGVPVAEARFYSQAFEGGGVLVTVQAKTDQIAQCAQKVIMKHGAIASEGAAAAR
jgi:hypothetical protein